MFATKADKIFKKHIKNILKNGYTSGDARPKYADGRKAHSKYITNVYNEYDLSKGEFPITTLRPIPVKSAIKEMLWIYQDKSNKLEDLKKYGVHYWDSWNVGDGTIGKRYGYTVNRFDIINRIIKQLEANPWNRRNVISLWDYESFDSSDGLLPCAYNIMFDVRSDNGKMYLDCTLTQRSSDLLVAYHINAMQYVSLQMMIAKHFGWELGKFGYYVQNLHIYDNQFDQANVLLRRKGQGKCMFKLEAPDKTPFNEISVYNFVLTNYEPVRPQLTFDLAI